MTLLTSAPCIPDAYKSPKIQNNNIYGMHSDGAKIKKRSEHVYL